MIFDALLGTVLVSISYVNHEMLGFRIWKNADERQENCLQCFKFDVEALRYVDRHAKDVSLHGTKFGI